MDPAGRRDAFAPPPLGSPAPCANAIPPSVWQFPRRSSPTRPPAAILPCWNSSSRQLHTRNPPRFVRFHASGLINRVRFHGIGRLAYVCFEFFHDELVAPR